MRGFCPLACPAPACSVASNWEASGPAPNRLLEQTGGCSFTAPLLLVAMLSCGLKCRCPGGGLPRGSLPQAPVTLLYHLRQGHRSDSHQQVSSPDQPVQVSHQDQCLCHPEGRDQERVDDASRTQQPASAGPHGHPPRISRPRTPMVPNHS
jgi:hypothetical protein